MSSDLVFNEVQVLDRVDNDIDLLCELIDIFQVEFPKDLAAIKAAAQSSNAKELHARSHALKSAVANVGGDRAFEILNSLEAAGKLGQVDDKIRLQVTELADQLNQLSQCLKQFQNKSRTPA